MMSAFRRAPQAIAAVALVAMAIVGLAACVRHVELHPDTPPPGDARRNDGGLPDAFAGDGIPGDAM